MAGANGPTSAAGTTETPNPEGGPAETGSPAPEKPEEQNDTKDGKAGDQNEDG